ncbi:MAG: hypothetical protein ABJA78_05545 [Ferruginibacter sp.]
MKKIIFLGMIMLSMNCLFAQTEKMPEDGGSPGCPMGCNTVLNFTFTTFNFHKPRTNCESGFGLCIKGVWSTHCDCGYYKPVTSIENGNVNCAGKKEGSKLSLYIPYALKDLDIYKNEDTSTFTVGEDISLIDGSGNIFAKVVPGDYKVKVEGNNFLIVVDLK